MKTPRMSVILTTPDRYENIRKTVHYLRAQTIQDSLELVIVAPSAEKLGADMNELEGFQRFRVREVGPIHSVSSAKVEGVLEANSPVIAFAEEHAYPEPGWAEALVRAHEKPWAAVGPAMINPNPASMMSCSCFFMHFGAWMDSAEAGSVPQLPPHNSSYKRQILLDYGPKLASFLTVEGLLHRDLGAKGYEMYLEPAARVHHVNISLTSSAIRHGFHGGRLFGASRAEYERWSLWKRFIHVAASGLVPLMRLRRLCREISRQGPLSRLLPPLLPSLLAGLAAHAAGEAAGYLSGIGDAERRYVTYELERYRHLTDYDRRALAKLGKLGDILN